MTLQSSGAISLSQVDTELGFASDALVNLSDAKIRTLFGIASGAISFSNGYGKSSVVAPVSRVWSIFASTPVARRTAAGVGTLNSSRILGGSTVGAGQDFVATTEIFDGTAYSFSSNMNIARGYFGAAGTSSLLTLCGGYPTNYLSQINSTESYNGSAFVTKANMLDIIARNTAIGTSTTTLSIGGTNVPNTSSITITVCNYFNGTAWASKPNLLSRGLTDISVAGSPTAALAVGGANWPYGNPYLNVETFNGTAWTSSTPYPVKMSTGVGSGSASNCLVAGGNIAYYGSSVCNSFNGTAWAAAPSLTNTRYEHNGGSPMNTSGGAWVNSGSYWTDASSEKYA